MLVGAAHPTDRQWTEVWGVWSHCSSNCSCSGGYRVQVVGSWIWKAAPQNITGGSTVLHPLRCPMSLCWWSKVFSQHFLSRHRWARGLQPICSADQAVTPLRATFTPLLLSLAFHDSVTSSSVVLTEEHQELRFWGSSNQNRDRIARSVHTDYFCLLSMISFGLCSFSFVPWKNHCVLLSQFWETNIFSFSPEMAPLLWDSATISTISCSSLLLLLIKLNSLFIYFYSLFLITIYSWMIWIIWRQMFISPTPSSSDEMGSILWHFYFQNWKCAHREDVSSPSASFVTSCFKTIWALAQTTQ